jgi:NAD(P)-dependent dehydrogenase (short-subunit alcohol dehydrogenase family)
VGFVALGLPDGVIFFPDELWKTLNQMFNHKFLKPMKFTRILVPCLFMFMALGSNAQTSKEISDEDLKKYAATMDSVKGMQESLQELVAEAVRSNTVMPVNRYNELFKLTGDEAKLKAANATAEEIAFLEQIDDLRKVNIERINATYQALAKDYVGLKAFNAIRKSLESDQALKARYDNVSKEGESKEKGG